MTKTPHKHAALIKQWADGATIQVFTKADNKWHDVLIKNPYWEEHAIYRVKPEKLKYRVGEFRDGDGNRYLSTVSAEARAKQVAGQRYFVRWISDWVEYDA